MDRWPGNRSRACARPSRRSTVWLASARAISAVEPADRLRPGERVEIVLDAQHRRRVDGRALENLLVELAALGHAEDLRQRPRRRVAFEPLDRARRQHDHAVRGLAAQRLLPGEGHDIELVPIERLRESRRGGVADREPARSALIQSALGTRTPEVVPFQVNTTSRGRIDLGEIGQRAVGRLEHGDVLELELLLDVADPAFAERFPGQHGDRARAEHRPQRHLDRAGVGRRHDADAVIGRHLQDFAGQIDGALELRLADLGSVRASQNRVGEGLQAPAGALGAGAGREVRDDRPHAGRIAHGSILPDRSPSVGRGVPPTGNKEVRDRRQAAWSERRRYFPAPRAADRLGGAGSNAGGR